MFFTLDGRPYCSLEQCMKISQCLIFIRLGKLIAFSSHSLGCRADSLFGCWICDWGESLLGREDDFIEVGPSKLVALQGNSGDTRFVAVLELLR